MGLCSVVEFAARVRVVHVGVAKSAVARLVYASNPVEAGLPSDAEALRCVMHDSWFSDGRMQSRRRNLRRPNLSNVAERPIVT